MSTDNIGAGIDLGARQVQRAIDSGISKQEQQELGATTIHITLAIMAALSELGPTGISLLITNVEELTASLRALFKGAEQ
jgi:hypothetical protein